MIQTKTFVLEPERRARLIALSKEMERNKSNPEVVARLIILHDELMQGRQEKLYDQSEELREVAACL
jgi:hypothetical protein